MALQMRHRGISVNSKFIATIIAVFALFVQPLVALNVPKAFAAGEAVSISTVAELRQAVENQADGQTWTINPGEYGVAAFPGITAQGHTGWYLPITASNLTINGVGNPTLYGTGYTMNSNWSTQNFISVFGDNVTINGLTLMPKVQPNKTIEVLGSDFTLTNTVFTPNTLTDPSEYDGAFQLDPDETNADYKQWGGSLYFSHAGNHTLTNVTVNNGGVSFRYAPAGTHIAFNNVKVVNTTDVDWINGYRYSSGFNDASNTKTGSPTVEYHVSAALGNVDSVFAGYKAGDTVVLDSDLTIPNQLTVNKPLTINGNGHTLSPNFAYSDNANNSALGILNTSDVIVNNLKVDGVAGTSLHGINVFESTSVTLTNVTSANNDKSGVSVNASTVTVSDITTSGNGWHGLNADKTGTVLTVNGTSTHNEAFADIYVDNDTLNVQVNDTNNQYGYVHSGLPSRDNDRVYRLKLAAPAIVAPGNSTFTKDPSFDNVFTKVAGAAKYAYETTYNNGVSSYADTSDSGNYDLSGTNVIRHNSGSPEATYKWRVRAIDANGIQGTWSEYAYVTVDKTAPAAPVLSAQTSAGAALTSGGYTKDYSITANWTQPLGSPVKYLYKYWNVIPGNPYDAVHPYVVETTSTTSSGVFNQGQGIHFMQIFAVDAAGNISAGSNVFQVNYDATKPTVAGERVDANTYRVTAADDQMLGKVVANLYKVGVSGVFKPHQTSTSDTLTIDLSTLVAGDYYIKYNALDKAGNLSTTYTYEFTIAPVEPTPEEPTDQGLVAGDSTTTEQPSAGGSTTAGQPSSSAPNPSNRVAYYVAPVSTGTGDESSEVVDDTTAPVPTNSVLDASTDSDSTSGNSDSSAYPAGNVADASTANSSGAAWYWWLVAIAAGIAAFWAFLAARRRRREDEETA